MTDLFGFYQNLIKCLCFEQVIYLFIGVLSEDVTSKFVLKYMEIVHLLLIFMAQRMFIHFTKCDPLCNKYGHPCHSSFSA